MDTIGDIRAAEFSGFETIAALRETRLAQVPDEPGVYLILNEAPEPPKILGRSTAPDPPYPLERLEGRCVDTPILYIGKAGGAGRKATLRSRLRAYLRQGTGHRAGHRGGRAIWQLEEADALLVAWMTTMEEPRDIERQMIADFVSIHGARPFANQVG